MSASKLVLSSVRRNRVSANVDIYTNHAFRQREREREREKERERDDMVQHAQSALSYFFFTVVEDGSMKFT